jgi:hypothetical protein
VQDDRIHASLYTDPRVFDDEMERIFARGWVFVGHDSEIPAPGDFVTRRIGAEPVIMVRGQDRAIAVLVTTTTAAAWRLASSCCRRAFASVRNRRPACDASSPTSR